MDEEQVESDTDIEQYSAIMEEAKEIKKALNLEKIEIALLLMIRDGLYDLRD